MKKISEKAFTLVELLIVIGILGILSTTLLITLNPAESQRKARDQKRIKDLTDMQTALLQYVDASGTFGDSFKIADTNNQGITCDSNWTGLNLCDYLKTVPTDPKNGLKTDLIKSSTEKENIEAYYRLRTSGSDFKLSARFESSNNASKLTSDGGAHTNSKLYFELYNNAALEP